MDIKICSFHDSTAHNSSLETKRRPNKVERYLPAGSKFQISNNRLPTMGAADVIAENVSAHDVMVFSKSYCPFCKRAVQILRETFGDAVSVLEMEERPDCDDLQDELLNQTGGRSVPRVFIKGKFVGGCDDVTELARKGELKALL